MARMESSEAARFADDLSARFDEIFLGFVVPVYESVVSPADNAPAKLGEAALGGVRPIEEGPSL